MSRGFRWALEGAESKELWTFRGKIIVHNNPDELRYLFAKSIEQGRYRIVELPSQDLGRPLLRLSRHPDNEDLVWPLNRADFVA